MLPNLDKTIALGRYQTRQAGPIHPAPVYPTTVYPMMFAHGVRKRCPTSALNHFKYLNHPTSPLTQNKKALTEVRACYDSHPAICVIPNICVMGCC